MPESLIVTGASGLLGHCLVPLGRKKYEVCPTHFGNQLFPDSVRMEITKREQVDEVFAKKPLNVVIHAAAQTNVDKCETDQEAARLVNIEGTRNIVAASARSNARLIFISTDYVFDGKKGLYTEDDTPAPVNYYGVTKLEAEKEVRKLSNSCIIRTGVIFGWHPYRSNIATWIIESLKENKTVRLVTDRFGSPTLNENLAEAVLRVVESGYRGVLHIAGKSRIDRYSFGVKLAERFGLRRDLIKAVMSEELESWKAKRPGDSSLRIDRAEQLVGVRMMTMEESLERLAVSAP